MWLYGCMVVAVYTVPLLEKFYLSIEDTIRVALFPLTCYSAGSTHQQDQDSKFLETKGQIKALTGNLVCGYAFHRAI